MNPEDAQTPRTLRPRGRLDPPELHEAAVPPEAASVVTSLEISIHFILHISPEKSLKATFSQSRWDSVVLNLLPSLEGRLFFMHSSRVSMSS